MPTETTGPLLVVQRVVAQETRRVLDDGDETLIYSAQQLIRQAWASWQRRIATCMLLLLSRASPSWG